MIFAMKVGAKFPNPLFNNPEFTAARNYFESISVFILFITVGIIRGKSKFCTNFTYTVSVDNSDLDKVIGRTNFSRRKKNHTRINTGVVDDYTLPKLH